MPKRKNLPTTKHLNFLWGYFLDFGEPPCPAQVQGTKKRWSSSNKLEGLPGATVSPGPPQPPPMLWPWPKQTAKINWKTLGGKRGKTGAGAGATVCLVGGGIKKRVAAQNENSLSTRQGQRETGSRRLKETADEKFLYPTGGLNHPHPPLKVNADKFHDLTNAASSNGETAKGLRKMGKRGLGSPVSFSPRSFVNVINTKLAQDFCASAH